MDPKIRLKLWNLCTQRFPESPYTIKFGNTPTQIDLEEVFQKKFSQYFLELGSGWGEVILQLASENPQVGFIGIEQKWDRLKKMEKKIHEKNIHNLLLSTINYQLFLGDVFPPASFDTIFMNFPDPWPKKKHHKKRAIQPEFLNTLIQLLKPKGKFYFATDHGGYFRHTIRELRKVADFVVEDKEWDTQRTGFPISEFESRKIQEGKRIYYIERLKRI